MKEVSQNCFIFDVVNLIIREASQFLTLSRSKIEEVSKNCCASDVVKFSFSKLADRQTDR